jgi:hypothetical protein
MIIKGNQPTRLESVVKALAGPDAGFAGTTWTEEGKGHGRRERRSIRTAPADGISWPHAARVFRTRRDSGPTRGPWTHKEIAVGITRLPARLAGPRHLASYARRHWALENREHYAREKTFAEDLQRVRTGNRPNAYAAIRNLVTGAFRRAGFASTAHARRCYGRDDQRILALCGYANQTSRTAGHITQTRRPWAHGRGGVRSQAGFPRHRRATCSPVPGEEAAETGPDPGSPGLLLAGVAAGSSSCRRTGKRLRTLTADRRRIY